MDLIDTAAILNERKNDFFAIGDRVRLVLDTIFNHNLVQAARGSFYGVVIELTFDENMAPVLREAPAGVTVVPAGLPSGKNSPLSLFPPSHDPLTHSHDLKHIPWVRTSSTFMARCGAIRLSTTRGSVTRCSALRFGEGRLRYAHDKSSSVNTSKRAIAGARGG